MQIVAKISFEIGLSTEISRDYYLHKLISRRGNGMIKVITGVRRCGKSYLLNSLFSTFCTNLYLH